MGGATRHPAGAARRARVSLDEDPRCALGRLARAAERPPLPARRRRRRLEGALEEKHARDRVIDPGLARLEAESRVDPASRFHLRQRVETYDRVAELAGAIYCGFGEPFSEACAACRGTNVEPLQLRGAVGEMLDRGRANERSVWVTRHEQRAVVAGERSEFVLEISDPELVPDPGRVLAEHHAQLGSVTVARVGDQLSFRSSSTSSRLSSNSPAATFARICSGFVAPAMTDVTAGCARRPANARSRRAMPRASANSCSASARSQRSSAISCPARRPSVAFSPRRYLPVSNPLARGKYGRKPIPSRSPTGSTSSSA